MKNIIFILLFFILVSVFVSAEEIPTDGVLIGKGERCHKEGGYNKLQADRAILNDKSNMFIDYCSSGSVLVEYYCGKDNQLNDLFKQSINCNCRTQNTVSGPGGRCELTEQEKQEIKKRDFGCEQKEIYTIIKVAGEQFMIRESHCDGDIAVTRSCKNFKNKFDPDEDPDNFIQSKIEDYLTTRTDCKRIRKVCNQKNGQCENEFGLDLKPKITWWPTAPKQGMLIKIRIVDFKKPYDKFIEAILEINGGEKKSKEIMLTNKQIYAYETQFRVPIFKVNKGTIKIIYTTDEGIYHSESFEAEAEEEIEEATTKEETKEPEKPLEHMTSEEFKSIIKEMNQLFQTPSKPFFRNFRGGLRSINDNIELRDIKMQTFARELILFNNDFFNACDKLAKLINKDAKGNFESKIKTLGDINYLYGSQEENMCSCSVEKDGSLLKDKKGNTFTFGCIEIESRALK